jgi:hypothetical protein
MLKINSLFAMAFVFSLLLVPVKYLGQQNEISSAVARLRASMSSLKLEDADKNSSADLLNRAEGALGRGYLFLSLHTLQSVWMTLDAQAYMEAKASVAKRGTAAFENDWRRLGRELAGKEKRLNSTAPSLPATVRALIQISRLQSRPYYKSGRLYGLQTTLDLGFYYMGIASGNIDFALFCQRLPFASGRPPLKLRPLTDQLAEIEAETLNAYEQSDAKDQARYNILNSRLKLASELDREKSLEGALQKYLEAVMTFGLITAPPVSADKLSSLKEQITASRARMSAPDQDHSIGHLFLEMAENAIASRQPETEADNVKRAAVILDQVLPRYFKYISEVNR